MNKKGKYIAVRPDGLIEARYDLTSRQNDILDMVLCQIDDDDNLLYELSVNDYKKLYKTDTSNVYRDLKKAVKEFEGTGFYLIDNSTKKEIFFSWFASIAYSDNESKIVVEVGQRLKKLLVEMKKRIFYKIEYPLNFNSIYSKRIYYYLKSFQDTGWRADNLDELRDKLKCPESYKKYSFFKIKVLDQASKEINNFSDINFEFEEIKTGRKVTAIKFRIKSNNVVNEICAAKEESKKVKVIKKNKVDPLVKEIKKVREIIKNTANHEISDRTAKTFYNKAKKHKEYGSKPLQLIEEVAEYSKTQSKDKGFVAWFNGTVEYYIRPKKQNKTEGNSNSTFNNFTEREYDFEELEKKLLGWDK